MEQQQSIFPIDNLNPFSPIDFFLININCTHPILFYSIPLNSYADSRGETSQRSLPIRTS
jgi:hypothetical protein